MMGLRIVATLIYKVVRCTVLAVLTLTVLPAVVILFLGSTPCPCESMEYCLDGSCHHGEMNGVTFRVEIVPSGYFGRSCGPYRLVVQAKRSIPNAGEEVCVDLEVARAGESDCVYENSAFRLQFERHGGHDHAQEDIAVADVPLPGCLSPKDGKCLVVKIAGVTIGSEDGSESAKAVAELEFVFRPFVMGSFYKWISA